MNNVNTIISIADRMPESFMACPGGRQIYTFRRPISNRRRFHLETLADGSADATVSYISDKRSGVRRRRILRFVISSDELGYTIRLRGRGIRSHKPVRLDRLSRLVGFESEAIAQIDGLIGVDERVLAEAASAAVIEMIDR